MLHDHFGPIELKSLPPARVACYRAVSAEPEHDSLEFMDAWLVRKGLDKSAVRIFGFDTEITPEQNKQGLRGYEAWVMLPPDANETASLAADGVRFQDFAGGKYAVMRLSDPFTDAYETIPGGWKHLHEWVLSNPDFMSAGFPWFEEGIETSGGVCLDLFHPVQPRSIQTGVPQEVRLSEDAPMLLAGMAYVGTNANGEIPRLWDEQFLPRVKELVGDAQSYTLYGAARWFPGAEPGVFEYLAAAQVQSFDSLPTGMVGWEIPAAMAAVLAANNVPDLGPLNDYFYGRWLPEHNWHLESGGDFLLEVYPPEFSSNGIIFLHFPVKKK